MDFISLTWQWLLTGSHWAGPDGVPQRVLEHLTYSVESMVIAAVIAVPLGLLTGHFRRGGVLVVTVGNAARALPTIGLLTLVVFLVGIGELAPLAALVAIAVPPILVTTYEAVCQVPADTVVAARSMGMTHRQVLFHAELPASLPLILLGFRNAAIQVVSTATIAAYVGMGGLGRYIFDGLAQRDYQLVAVGALLAALLAVLTEALFFLLERVIVSPGLQRRQALRLRIPSRSKKLIPTTTSTRETR